MAKKLTERLVAIYDFGLLPYALGDVLAWNVQTAIRSEQLGCAGVDIYLCIDPERPAFGPQRQFINRHNSELFFTELHSAFCTHPRLGDIHIYRSRESLLAELDRVAGGTTAVADYVAALRAEGSSNTDGWMALGSTLPRYYFVQAQDYGLIARFAAEGNPVPHLQPAAGCSGDVDALFEHALAGKRIVPFHLRLRQLDRGYGGSASYMRDSDFSEWFSFLKAAAKSHPEVQFIALGRLQEKPLDILSLPNVTSLRLLGMGLGHELTLMLRSDAFIGTSSGFAECAVFSSVPYFITKMTETSCSTYGIPFGASRLPFACADHQELTYGPETADFLLGCLEKVLEGRRAPVPVGGRGSLAEFANTSRFFVDHGTRRAETQYLLLTNRTHQTLSDQIAYAKELETKLASQIANSQELEAKFTRQVGRAEELESKLAKQISYSEELEGKLASQIGNSRELETKLTKQVDYAESLESKLAKQITRCEELETILAKHVGHSMELEARLAKQIGHAEMLENQLAKQINHSEELEIILAKQVRHSEELECKLATQVGHAQELEGKFAKQVGHSEELEGKLAKQVGRSEGLEGKLAKQVGHSEELEAKLAKQIGYAEELESKLASQVSHSEEFEARLAQQIGHAEELESKLTWQINHSEELETKLAKQVGHSGELEGKLATQIAHAKELEGKLAEQVGHSEELEGKLATQVAHAKELEGKLAEQVGHSEELEARLAKQIGYAEALEAKLTKQVGYSQELEANLTAQRAEAQRLQNLLGNGEREARPTEPGATMRPPRSSH